ncbi:MAG: hypothetical protein KAH07_08365 [Flavobacteriaceae bacterium]|nr:hypothetical protein [Flavobacteriaceae bacterium]
MGIGFTVDTPLKVAPYGIDSVIFISDDILLEKLRKMYSDKFEIPYQEITDKIEDFRAKRITSYLNLIKNLAERKFDEVITTTSEVKKYFRLLSDSNSLKQEFKELSDKISDVSEIKNWLKENMSLGDINVNIMTKLDKPNFKKSVQLSQEHNDAHAALRGYANSDLTSSMVFSAGMNPRLFSYIDQFADFFPNEKGEIKKKIILKVSDYRSALIQGKFLAKKGIWVSEYRIESGLNCGGHAFATDGFLIGPILEEFKNNKEELITSVTEILNSALESKGKNVPSEPLDLKVTAQGGVGTAEEQSFLLDHYKVDSVGWGSPFLLVPEVTNVDPKTLELLLAAKEDDLYLSNVSPIGIPFNNLRNSSDGVQRKERIDKGITGSPCPKKFLALVPAANGKTICPASRKYQNAKIKDLELEKSEMSEEAFQKEFDNITDKSCLCVGLGNPVMIVNDMDRKIEGNAVAVCPGPNLAYYSKVKTLEEMAGHIYGRGSVIERTDRPSMFIKELGLYLSYLKTKVEETTGELNRKQVKYFTTFTNNMKEGISYYVNLFNEMKGLSVSAKNSLIEELDEGREQLCLLIFEIEKLKLPKSN